MRRIHFDESKPTEEVEHVLKDEEESDLGCELLQGGERNLPGSHAEEFCHRVEKPDLNI